MKCSKFKNKSDRTKLQDYWQWVITKLKLRYFDNRETSKNPFYNECKLYFSNKHFHSNSNTILIERGNLTKNSNGVIKMKPY